MLGTINGEMCNVIHKNSCPGNSGGISQFVMQCDRIAIFSERETRLTIARRYPFAPV